MRGNTGARIWADATYRFEGIGAKLYVQKIKSRIHRKGKRGKPKANANNKSHIRVRLEHIFSPQSDDMGGTFARTIGTARAKANIGMKTPPATWAASSSCAA